jgi:hypothetical protein
LRTFNRAAFSSCDGESPSLNYLKVPPRFELRLLDSESKVLTITPWNWLVENRFSFDYALQEPCGCRKECDGRSKWYKGTNEIQTPELLFTRQALEPTKLRRQPMR